MDRILLFVWAVVNPEATPKKQRWASVAIWLGLEAALLPIKATKLGLKFSR